VIILKIDFYMLQIKLQPFSEIPYLAEILGVYT